MMKYIMIFLTLLIFLVACKSETKEQVEEIKINNQENSAVSNNMSDFDNDYLVSIYEAQELIKIDGKNIELRKQYCQKAYHEDRGFFISMGIARKTNPETGQAIPVSLAERSATIDAMRWAAYGLNWIKKDYQPDFGKIEIPLIQNYSILNRANVGDSLFVFVATRVE